MVADQAGGLQSWLCGGKAVKHGPHGKHEHRWQHSHTEQHPTAMRLLEATFVSMLVEASVVAWVVRDSRGTTQDHGTATLANGAGD